MSAPVGLFSAGEGNLPLCLVRSLATSQAEGSSDLNEKLIDILSGLGQANGFSVRDKKRWGEYNYIDHVWYRGRMVEDGTVVLAVENELNRLNEVEDDRDKLLRVNAAVKLLVYDVFGTEPKKLAAVLLEGGDRHANEWFILNLNRCTGRAEGVRWTRADGLVVPLSGFPYRWHLTPELPPDFYRWCVERAFDADGYHVLRAPLTNAARLRKGFRGVRLDGESLPRFLDLCRSARGFPSAGFMIEYYPEGSEIGSEE